MLTRTQVGWLNEHPVRLHCGRCNILLSGTARFSSPPPQADVVFDNAESVEEAIPAYYAEVSGELLTVKLSPYDGNPYRPPSFFHAAIDPMGFDGFGAFKTRTLKFLAHSKESWPLVRRVNELWRDGNHKFLPEQCRQVLPEKQFPLNSTLEILRGVHQVNLLFLSPVLDDDRFEASTSFYFKVRREIVRGPLFSMVQALEERSLLPQYEAKLFERIEAFSAVFRYLIPIFGTRFYQPDRKSYDGKGVTTASFEDVKQFYLDTYEVVTEVATLVAAYNNVRHRGDYTAMLPVRKDVKTLDDFESKTKASRLEYFSRGEDFDRFISPIPDNKLRNTIGHNSYRFDGARQLLIYNPDLKGKPEKALEKEFVAFLQECWNLFLIVVDLAELVYQARKVYRALQGDSFVSPEVFKSRSTKSLKMRKRRKK